MTQEQINYIRENFSNELTDYINEKIDNELIYYTDIEEHVNRFSNIVEVLRGEYTMNNLCDDLYEEFHEDDDTYKEFYDEYLDEEQQLEVDEV